MFIISFAIFIFTLTVFENIFLATLFLILILLGQFIRKKIQPDSVKSSPDFQSPSFFRIGAGSKVYLFIILAFLISLGSVFFKNYTYDQKIKSLPNLTGTISQDMDGPVGKYFVGTGMISDIYSYQRFVFQDNAGREYFLNSTKKYEIGDIIRLNGYVSLAYTGAKNIFDIHGQWQNFTSKPEFSGLFNYEFNYPKWLMMKGFYGTIYEQSSVVASLDPGVDFEPRGQGDSISFIQKIRKNLQKSIVQAYGENKQAGLILGMLVGDKSQIPPDEYQGFIDSGLVHIIAVSGGNIIMIVVFLGAVLFFLPFYVRNAVILLTIILYAMVCGMDSSVFRATIMGGLGMLALFWGKEINIRRAMSIAFIVMLIVNPYFLTYDVGFLLSFSAIIGIIYFGGFVSNLSLRASLPDGQACLSGRQGTKQSMDSKSRLPRWRSQGQKVLHKFIKEFVTPTIGATLGVLPVMLFFMGKTNLTGILANFLVVPLVAFVMIYGFISTMLFKFIPREIRLWPQKILLNYIYFISDLAQKFGIYLQAEGAWIKYALLLLFIIWLILEKRKKT